MSDIELVIACHEEDLAWTRNVVPGIRLTVYNKGGKPSTDHIPLPNVGREAHTYLYHLVTRYDSLSPVTVFCQGHPFDHCSHFHTVLRKLQASDIKLLPSFKWLGFIIDWDDTQGRRLFLNWSKNERGETLEMKTFSQQLWAEGEEKPREPFKFYPGAQFIVTRETVHLRPLPFYEKALEVSGSFPNAAHCFERIWDRFFGVNGIPEDYREQPLPIYLKPIKRLGSA